ncbi:MAG: hypothetical protein AB1512_29655 [Thermodesulfobacteriota bacterium]
MTKRYVQLNRTFLDFHPQDPESDLDTLLAIAELTGNMTDWDALLQSRCVVVLGEAGSGKTCEFSEKVRSLQEAGKQAFFCAIEDLADEGLEAALPDQSHVKRFRAWVFGEDQGFFFLDSIDEARLKGHSLDKALRKLNHSLTGCLQRSRFAISCRVSDWLAEADRDTIERFIPGGSNERLPSKGPHGSYQERTAESVRIVHLARLSREQIQKLAQALGLNETNAFLQAIGQADAWRYAERPRDVEWLVDFWKANNRLGTLTEIVKENIKNKLKETNLKRQPKDPLAQGEALTGAATLAAAATLCKVSSIKLPDEAIDTDRTHNAIDPQQVLSHWPQKKINALLTRAVFDGATYGRVRFHHRSITEYLAALWLKGLIEKGCPRVVVEELLFKERYGCQVIAPSMAPLTAWLANWDSGIRQKLLKIASEVLIQYGDPQAIPVAERRELLRKYAQRYLDRKRTFHRFDWAMLRRFAHKDLGSTISDLLRLYRAQSDVRILLLELVEYGQIAECAKRALAIALDEKEDQDVRLQAIQAVVATGSPRELQRLKKYVLSGKGVLPNRLLGTICEGLFPVYLDLHELLHAARQARPQPPLSSRLLPYQFERIVQKCPRDWLLALAEGFLHLVGGRVVTETKEDRDPSFRYAWLIDPMCKLVARILDELPAEDTLAEALLSTIEFVYVLRGKEYGHHSEFEELDEKVAKAPQIRRALFWRHVEDERSKGKETVMYLWELRLGDLKGWSGIVADDLDWLIADISEKQAPLDRLLALDTALTSWHTAGRPQADLKRICLAVGNDPKLKDRLDATLNPPPRKGPDYDKEQKKREKARKRKEEKRLRDLREYMEKEIKTIRTGENLGALLGLWEFMSKGSSHNKLGYANWTALIPSFGKAIAGAAREGFMRFWRTWKPPFPHEKAEQHTIENGVIAGLTGIALAVDGGLDLQTLSEQDAGIAACYATREFSFPAWLPRLAEAQPSIVRQKVRLALAGEILHSSEKHHIAGVLGHLAYDSSIVRDLCAPDLMDLIEKQDPKDIQNLHLALMVLLSSENINRPRLAELAGIRTQDSENELPRFLAWLVAWLHLDGEGAVGFMESYLKGLETLKSHAFLLKLAGAIYPHSRRMYEKAPADYFRVPVLLRLIPLVYSYIRLEDDVFREGTIPSGTRDNAQDFRRHLVDSLGATPGQEAFDALMTLAEDPRIGRHRDWFLMLAQERAAQDAESSPWEPEEVSRFAAKSAAPLKSADDLFDLAIHHLQEVKADTETGDSSERELFHPETKESAVKKWVVNRLEGLAQGRFSVGPEEEVDQHKKPDIRLRCSAVTGPIAIEIKRANKLSYSELEAALADQLVGRYLRDIRSRHGILLLAHLGGKGGWRPEGRSTLLEFSALVGRLNEVATRLAHERNDLAALRVIGIDFTP